MSEQTLQKKKFNFASYGAVVAFLCLEILAFISFNLGHSFVLYGSLSLALGLILLLVTFRQIKMDGISSFAFFLFPILIYGVLTALSTFSRYSLGYLSTAEVVFIPIALTFISLAGYLTSFIERFKIRNALIVIYGALAIFVAINLLVTMIYYKPFYTLIYQNSYTFYAGRPSVAPIGTMAYMLYGFSFVEVSVDYWSFFPSILLTAVIPLFFMKYKDNKKEFILYIIFTVIAFLSLLFTITKFTLLCDLVLILGIVSIILCGKFMKVRKVIDWLVIIVLGLALIVIVLLFIMTNGWGNGLKNILSKSVLLNKIFISNRFATNFSTIMKDMFSSWKIFGCYIGDQSYNYPNFESQIVSNSWLFDNIMSSGIFGAIFFLLAIVIGIRRMFKYYQNSDDSLANKLSIFGFVLATLVIGVINYDVTPLINSDSLSPFYTSSPLLISLFLISYCFAKSNKLGEKKEATKKEDDTYEIKA